MQVPEDIKARYLERRRKDLEDCQESLSEKKFQIIEKVGHQLKGNGFTFGHPELSVIGKKLENAAILGDFQKIEIALKEFASWVNSAH